MSDKLKVVVCRDLGPDVMPLLLNNSRLDVGNQASAMKSRMLIVIVQGGCMASQQRL